MTCRLITFLGLSLAILGVKPITSAAQGRRARLARTFVIQAKQHVIKENLPRAVVLLRGAWELARNPNHLRLLAQIHTMTGQWDEAVENYELALKMGLPAHFVQNARSEITRMKNAPAPFSQQLLSSVRARVEAKKVFNIGVKLARKKKKYAEAEPYLMAALVLDPMAPGPYRVLGAVHGKLKNPAKERRFLQAYLQIRPVGRIANQVRKRLRPHGVLTAVDITSSFPCNISINGYPLGNQTPVKDFLLPPGNITISFENRQKYRIVRNMRVRIKGKKMSVDFPFGVLVNKLEKPYGRVRANGRDLGLWTEVGLPCRSQGLAYRLEFTALNNTSRKKRMSWAPAPGKKKVVETW